MTATTTTTSTPKRIACAALALVLAATLAPTPQQAYAATTGASLAATSVATQAVTATKAKTKLAAKNVTASTLTYTGKALAPKVTVKVGSKTLKRGRDYTLTVRNAKGKKVSAPKAKGTYHATVKGKGSYTGTVTKTFKVGAAETITGETKTVYVLAKNGENTTYAYSKDGLLTKQKSGGITTTYAYDKNNYVVKKTQKQKGGSTETTYKRNAKGLPTHETWVYKSGKEKTTHEFKYGIKSGKVSYRMTKLEKGYGVPAQAYFYDNSGRIIKKGCAPGYSYEYSYDDKGNVAETTWYENRDESTQNLRYANTYDSRGLLTSRQSGYNGRYGSFSYKAIMVPKALVSKVKAQQWALLNNNLNFVF